MPAIGQVVDHRGFEQPARRRSPFARMSSGGSPGIRESSLAATRAHAGGTVERRDRRRTPRRDRDTVIHRRHWSEPRDVRERADRLRTNSTSTTSSTRRATQACDRRAGRTDRQSLKSKRPLPRDGIDHRGAPVLFMRRVHGVRQLLDAVPGQFGAQGAEFRRTELGATYSTTITARDAASARTNVRSGLSRWWTKP